jgi:heme exporter protein B
VGATVFVIYIAIRQPAAQVWNALFWIIQLFITVNTVAKSFLQDSPARMLYYQMITGPVVYIVSKLIYNVLLMVIMSLISFGLYFVFMGNPLVSPLFFIAMVCLGGISLALVFTMLAAIAAKAAQNAAIIAIMGFPIIIPALMMLVKLSGIAFLPVFQPGLLRMILLLGALDILAIALSLILFPILWKN